jgi:methane monooxygenase PmoA-like
MKLLHLTAFLALALNTCANFIIIREPHALVLKDDTMPVLRYHLQQPVDSKLSVESGCYFHPLTTPSGITITEVAPSDHPHHRGIFLAWVEMRGNKDADFWGWGEHAPKKHRVIVNRELGDVKGGFPKWAFLARNEWLAEGTVVIKEMLDAEIKRESNAHILDLSYTLTPVGDTTLARWAFSGFCVRTRKEGKLQACSPDGPVTFKNPKHTEPETDWPDAAWYDYTLTFEDGKVAGVAVINHPKNPPTLWHNHRDVRMLNPCIVAPGSIQLKAGQPLLLRYRVVAHDGPVPRDLLNRLKFQ